MDWFRFYSETIRDTKVRRVARKAGQSPAHVIGVWSILLSMASESPERGVLLLSDGVPVTVDDIEDVTGCNVSETLHEMLQVGMLAIDGDCYAIPAWDKRQFASDNSTSRVNKHRNKAKNAEKGAEKEQNETLQKRFGNAPETESETESETEEESAAAETVREAMTRQYESVLGMVPIASYPEMTTYMHKLHARNVTDWWGLALTETTQAKRPGWHYMKAVLEAWLAAGAPSHRNGNGADPERRSAGVVIPPAKQAEIDKRQAEYEKQIALELAQAHKEGRL
jgi:hypothetical protein